MDRNELIERLSPFIAEYKALIQGQRPDLAYNELYKWRVFKHFQEHWPETLDEHNVVKALNDSFSDEGQNLWAAGNYFPMRMLKIMAEEAPQEVAHHLNTLFDESVPYPERMFEFESWAGALLKRLGHEGHHYQYDRAMMVYLSLRYPDRYFLYKNGMFNDFCRVTEVQKPYGKGKRLNYDAVVAFMKLCDSVKAVICSDEELLQIHQSRVPAAARLSNDENLLTQDFIFSVASYLAPDPSFVPTQEDDEVNTAALNQILYGPPGTGKTYATIQLAVDLIVGPTGEKREAIKKEYDRLRSEGQIEFITFHQNYAYEDFMIGIRPDLDEGNLSFSRQRGVFYQLSERARQNFEAAQYNGKASRSFDEALEELLSPLEEGKEVKIKMQSNLVYHITSVTERTIPFRNPKGNQTHSLSIETLREIATQDRKPPVGLRSYYVPLVKRIRELQQKDVAAEPPKNFVLIIDEINRGNISKIFGELITLLEPDKRIGQPNELRLALPNGERNFGVPPNLFIIGTMNTADKSIAMLDAALRRRFTFVGKFPDPSHLDKDLGERLNRMNSKLVEMKGSGDWMIGHAYFMKQEELQAINDQVIPLLYEYFSGRNDFVREVLEAAGYQIEQDSLSRLWTVIGN